MSFEPADISVSYRIAADRNFSEIAREDGELKLGQVGSAVRSTFTSDGILDKVSLFEVGARFVSFMDDLVHVLGLEDKVGRLLVDAGGGKGRASAKRIIAAELPMGYRRAAYTTITSELLMTCEKYAASDNLFVPKGLTAPAGGLNSSHVPRPTQNCLKRRRSTSWRVLAPSGFRLVVVPLTRRSTTTQSNTDRVPQSRL